MSRRQGSLVAEIEVIGDQYLACFDDSGEQLIIRRPTQTNFNDMSGFISRTTQGGRQAQSDVLVNQEAQLARCPLCPVPFARYNICRISDRRKNVISREAEFPHYNVEFPASGQMAQNRCHVNASSFDYRFAEANLRIRDYSRCKLCNHSVLRSYRNTQPHLRTLPLS